MNARRYFMTPVILAGVFLLVLAADAQVIDQTKQTRPYFNIHTRWNPDQAHAVGGYFYLASNHNGWATKDIKGEVSLNRSLSLSISFKVPMDWARDPDFQFKITRGSWETVEVDANGRDIPNRTIPSDIVESGGHSYTITIEGFADQRPKRWPELEQANSTVTGHLNIFDHSSEALSNSRKIRVWTPPGYRSLELADKQYPVLYMHDGQNLFDTATSFIGVEWGVDETLTELITTGAVPPMIVVGIDNAGKDRANEYLPSVAGGNADAYLAMLTDELMPLINERYRTLTGPEHTAMGGSSYGGVITLTAAMRLPGVFGAILVESPSLWVGKGKFLDMVKAHNDWPQRVFIGMGTTETDRDDGTNERFVKLTREVEAAFRAKGLDDSSLQVVIEEGAAHNEQAWALRLPDALRFLFGM